MLEEHREDLQTALPGRVESYDPATQTANVKPMIKRVSREGVDAGGVDGTRVVDELPVIPAVPVVWPRGGGYFMTFPLATGDSGLIVFSARDIGAWRDSGQVSDPGDEGLHTLSGAVFIPGLETVAKKLTNADAGTGHAVIGKEGGTQIHIDASAVQLGAAGGAFVALAPALLDYFAQLEQDIAAAFTAVGAALAANGALGATAFNTSATGRLPLKDAVAATKAKAT